MHYRDLNDLIQHSKSSRKFFLSLPVDVQIRLHEYADFITNAQKLHRTADAACDSLRAERIGGYVAQTRI